MGVLTMDAQLPLPWYGDRSGRPVASLVSVVLCKLVSPVSCGGRGDRRPADSGGCVNWPMGAWWAADDDFGRGSVGRDVQGEDGGCDVTSFFVSSGADMAGAMTKE